jgi:putative transposase
LNQQEVVSCIKLFESKIKVSQMLVWTGIARSSYYYRCKTGKRGRKPSTHTRTSDGALVLNTSIVIVIKFILRAEFVDYGYPKVGYYMRRDGIWINDKKVYRLMTESNLLCNSKIASRSHGRRYVQYYTQPQDAPLKQICMDIKYLYIHGAGRNALMLTVLDVGSRMNLGQLLSWNIRKHQVKWLLGKILEQHQVDGMTIRTDNGAQFVAHLVQEFLAENQISQEFTHVATPEENAFIEAYHSLIERVIERRYVFESIYEAGLVLGRWKNFYNEDRLHSGLGKKTPRQVWDEHFSSVEPVGPPIAAKPVEKSRPASAALYSLDFFGGEAKLSRTGETEGKKRLTNIELLSSY